MSEWIKPVFDQRFFQSITAIHKRAEKQLDWDKLIQTYVMNDLMQRANAEDSQLVF